MTTTEVDPNEVLDAGATIFTRVTCPYCGDVFDVEGDAADDKLDCTECKGTMVVRRT